MERERLGTDTHMVDGAIVQGSGGGVITMKWRDKGMG